MTADAFFPPPSVVTGALVDGEDVRCLRTVLHCSAEAQAAQLQAEGYPAEVFLDPTRPLSAPVVRCASGTEQEAMVVFSGHNCPVWMPTNALGCHWNASVQARVPPLCQFTHTRALNLFQVRIIGTRSLQNLSRCACLRCCLPSPAQAFQGFGCTFPSEVQCACRRARSERTPPLVAGGNSSQRASDNRTECSDLTPSLRASIPGRHLTDFKAGVQNVRVRTISVEQLTALRPSDLIDKLFFFSVLVFGLLALTITWAGSMWVWDVRGRRGMLRELMQVRARLSRFLRLPLSRLLAAAKIPDTRWL